MKTRFLSIVAAFALTGTAAAQPTALTYQGRLKSGGQPASGLHDFRFRLFDAEAGGTQLGSTQCLNNVTVADGLFTAPIDFGQQFASPDERFLEIQVREDTGLNCNNANGFVTLNPRQPLTATPLASHANSAFTLDAADGGPANAVFVDDSGRVGIGTQAPSHTVTVAVPAPTIALQDTDFNSTQVGYLSYRNANNAETGWMGFGDPGNPHFGIVNARSSGNIFLLPFSGNVGIGTVEPQAALDVRGDIRLGPVGEFRATSGEENLRVVRGIIRSDGSVAEGTGFICTRFSDGQYHIEYDRSFADVPAVTATAHYIGGEHRFAEVCSDCPSNAHETWVYIRTHDDDFVASPFAFVAIGPR